MSVLLKCAACGHEVPFQDGDLETEAICPGCEVLLRRRTMADLMAIPVSMALPESFVQADLGSVPKHSRELIHRYNKGSVPVVQGNDSNVILARAIERLAMALEGGGASNLEGQSVNLNSLVDTLVDNNVDSYVSPPDYYGESSEESGSPEELENSEALEDSEESEVFVLNGSQSGNGKSTSVGEDGRALPVGAPVLVRREAAAEAHRYRRENQATTDIKGQKQSAGAEWVEKHPIFMMMTGLLFLVALVVMTWMWMNEKFTPTSEMKLKPAMADETNIDGPDFRHAEREARGFLNSVSLNAARPYIYRASQIAQKLDAYYQPIPDPGNYSLEFRSRNKTGDRAVYYYQVKSGEKTQPVVVLQERENFKVFWEFGACIGDLSWAAFMDGEPPEPILMKAFLRPDSVFEPLHPASSWSSWLAQDWEGEHTIRVYCRKGSPQERRLNSALREFPVVRDSLGWVMAQVSLQHLDTYSGEGRSLLETSEALDVPLGSWLPKEFVEGNTFYSEKDRLRPSGKEVQGLKERSAQ